MASSRKDRMAKRGSSDGDPQPADGELPDGEQPVDPLHRDNVPGELDNASGEVDEFEAATRTGGLEGDEDPAGTPVPATAVPGAATTGSSGPRFINFLRACWAELQRVQWPDRAQVGQGTAVTLGFVVVAGLYLGVADEAAQRLVDLIL